MRLKYNHPDITGYTFRVVCRLCGTEYSSSRLGYYADLDGEPFKAYYCSPCAITITRKKGAAHVSLPTLSEK